MKAAGNSSSSSSSSSSSFLEREGTCEWGRGAKEERENLMQTPCSVQSPTRGLIPRPWDRDLSQNRESKSQLTERHPGAPVIFLYIFPETELVDHISLFSFWGISILFSRMATPVCIPTSQQCTRVPLSPHPHQHLVSLFVFKKKAYLFILRESRGAPFLIMAIRQVWSGISMWF